MTLQEKLFKVRQEVGKIERKKQNPFTKSYYFDINQLIEQLDPILEANRLLLLQPIRVQDGRNMVVSRIVDLEDGQAWESVAIMPDNPDPQKMGSAITYLRRYTLQSLLGLQAGDDDGNTASGKVHASLTQKNLIESLLHTSTISEDEKVAIERRLVGEDNPLTKEEASRGIAYLKENQQESIDETLNTKIENDK